VEETLCIEVEDVSFSYHGHPVLEHVRFQVRAGEYVGIIGPNGGGKTTLLKIMLGLLRPDEGEVRIFGESVSGFRKRHLLGYVPQRAAQEVVHFPVTVDEVVRSGRTARVGLLRRLGRDDLRAVDRAMEVSGVREHRGRPVGTLSGGERQRVFIARALAGEPRVLLLDEPVVGVDIAAKERFYSFLTHLKREMGMTIIFVSHDVGAIAHEVDTVVCLNRTLVCHGLPEDFIKEEYLSEVYGRKVRSIFHDH
jgi:zinc transport system ATP-binding protein